MRIVVTLLCLVFQANLSLSANDPGVEWSQEVMDNVRGKLEFLWSKHKLDLFYFGFNFDFIFYRFTQGHFNIDTGKEEFSRYVYDPSRSTVDAPYEDCTSKEACDRFWKDVDAKLRFSPEKVLRLVFHDCIPYKDDDDDVVGGCDGCLNLDENLEGKQQLYKSDRRMLCFKVTWVFNILWLHWRRSTWSQNILTTKEHQNL